MLLNEKFKETLDRLGVIDSNKKLLLAVSGGIDSMVMMHLFSHQKINCTVAHCNFQLRGQESDGDEAFVREQAANLYYKIFVTRFETTEYASENKLSIQMAARELRYTWFEKLVKVHEFDYIAVAHNRDDAIETFFINLGRGTGIAGLTGIRTVTDNVLRPLLYASRSNIEKYAVENNIPFREDSSNASDKYLRNYIRHKIIPGFEDAFPHFREAMSQNLDRLNDAYNLYQQSIAATIPQLTKQEDDLLYINIPALLSTTASKTILFEILKAYGFSSVSIDEIYQAAYAIPGKQFHSATYKLVKDRECFILSKYYKDENHRYYIDEETSAISEPISLSFEVLQKDFSFSLPKDNAIAYLDCDKIEYPLMLRKWQPGDYFMPLGMTGMKKLSDFFVDIKLSLIDKENIWILASGNHIVWIVGRRIDNRYKVTENTSRILKISGLVLTNPQVHPDH